MLGAWLLIPLLCFSLEPQFVSATYSKPLAQSRHHRAAPAVQLRRRQDFTTSTTADPTDTTPAFSTSTTSSEPDPTSISPPVGGNATTSDNFFTDIFGTLTSVPVSSSPISTPSTDFQSPASASIQFLTSTNDWTSTLTTGSTSTAVVVVTQSTGSSLRGAVIGGISVGTIFLVLILAWCVLMAHRQRRKNRRIAMLPRPFSANIGRDDEFDFESQRNPPASSSPQPPREMQVRGSNAISLAPTYQTSWRTPAISVQTASRSEKQALMLAASQSPPQRSSLLSPSSSSGSPLTSPSQGSSSNNTALEAELATMRAEVERLRAEVAAREEVEQAARRAEIRAERRREKEPPPPVYQA